MRSKSSAAPSVTRLTSFELHGPYPVVIPHRGEKTIAGLVAEGRYDYANPGLTDEHFSDTIVSGDEAVDLYLALFDRDTESDQNIADFDREGFKAEKMSGLLTLGKTFPDLQRDAPIVELGQSWEDSKRIVLVGFLIMYWDDDSRYRYASLCNRAHRWARRCRFAVRRK